ncbi:MAG: signal recognition particle protein [Oscillospiraceae bacterium]|jgi:signal recognition particle subunit SRP54|nr:signal recognition particle protein [Oscillospiraceae bacterium]
MFERLASKVSSALRGLRFKTKISEQDVKIAMREIRLALLDADVNYGVVRDFTQRIQGLAISQEILGSLTPVQQIIKMVHEELTKLLGQKNERINFAPMPPSVVLMCGLQGSGKTTHVAKLAHFFKINGKRVLLVACDIYRAAAIEQLKISGERVGCCTFEEGKLDPVAVAKNGVKYAKDNGYDVVIIDTAGRLQVDVALMDELQKISKAVNISETLLVLDSMAGQDAVNVAVAFDEKVAISGIILTKLDSDTRGGVAFSVSAVTKKPIKFVGIGEKYTDLEVFHPERMAARILGMGDTLSLIEKVESAFGREQEAKLNKKNFDLNDLLSSMQSMKKLGSLKNLVSLLPGVGHKVTEDQLDKGEKELIKTKALVFAMTPKERTNPLIIDASRRRRIASGSGLKVEDLNRLLKQFNSMCKLMKQFDRSGKKRYKKT